MFYFGIAIGAVVGFLASIAFPGVIARLRAGYFAKLKQAEAYGQKELNKL